MSKNNIIILVAGVLVVLGVGLYVKKIEQNKDYSVVYLSTGEVYVGKLSVFPSFKLDNAYILQIAKDEKDPTKSNFHHILMFPGRHDVEPRITREHLSVECPRIGGAETDRAWTERPRDRIRSRNRGMHSPLSHQKYPQ